MKKVALSDIVMIMFFVLLTTMGTASSETLTFQDSFDSGIGANWTTGTNTAMHSASAFTVEDGKVSWNQSWDYIETSAAFSGNFRVEVDIDRPGASNQCKDFSVELVNAPLYSGAVRLQYGTYKKDCIELGQAPDFTSSTQGYRGVCLSLHGTGSSYFREMDTVTPHTGTVSLTYLNGQITFAFRNSQGQTICTPAADAGDIGATKIRISSQAVQLHYVSEVRLYSLDDVPASNCAAVDLNSLNIDIPCIQVGEKKYHIKLIYDPSVQGGIYWKLDMNFLQEVTD